MSQVVQLENVTAEGTAAPKEKDTWILELPPDVCRREGYPEGTMVSLTVKNGGVHTSIIHPSAEVDEFIDKVVEEEKEFFEEMTRLGD